MTALPSLHRSTLHITPLSDVTIAPVHWLWPNYLPLGKLVVIDGFPGKGKSAMTLDIAARLSRGRPMPDGSGASQAPADTLVLTYEDHAADTIRPRLEAAEADLSRVHYVDGMTQQGTHRLIQPSIPLDLEPLENAIAERPDVRLLIIDPLAAALAKSVNSLNEQSMRRVLSQIAGMAEECNICVVVIRHFRKNPGRNALTAGGGSMGIVGHARVTMIVDQHPENASASVLAMPKNNLGLEAPSLVFEKRSATVRSHDDIEIPTMRIEWTGAIPLTANELLRAQKVSEPEQGSAVDEWLRDALAGGRVERQELWASGLEVGFSADSVRRAGDRLAVVRTREGRRHDHRCFWALPDSTLGTESTLGSENEVPRVESLPRVEELGSVSDTQDHNDGDVHAADMPNLGENPVERSTGIGGQSSGAPVEAESCDPDGDSVEARPSDPAVRAELVNEGIA